MFNHLRIHLKYWFIARFSKRNQHNVWEQKQTENQDLVNLLYMEQFMQNHR